MNEQLAALARVTTQLDANGIDHWLFGGWAVDFYAGKVTRPHSDIDLTVWREDLPRIVALLEEDGWRHAPEQEEDGGTGYERDGVRLELTYLVTDDDGRTCIPLERGLIAWPEGAFADDVRELDGVRTRVIALPALRQTKSSQRDDPDDAAKDSADLARLEP